MNLLIEEYIEGHEIDIEILIQNDQVKFFAISDNFSPLEPKFYTFYEQGKHIKAFYIEPKLIFTIFKGGLSPSLELSNKEKQKIQSLVTSWLSKLGFRNALLHFEARCKPESLFKRIHDSDFIIPIEINMRLGGAETWSMIKSSYNVDLIKEHLNICLGLELDEKLVNKTPLYRSISINLYPNEKCILDKVYLNRSKIMSSKELMELNVYRSIGDKLETKDNIAWLSVRNGLNSTLDEMKLNLNNSLGYIKFDYFYYE